LTINKNNNSNNKSTKNLLPILPCYHINLENSNHVANNGTTTLQELELWSKEKKVEEKLPEWNYLTFHLVYFVVAYGLALVFHSFPFSCHKMYRKLNRMQTSRKILLFEYFVGTVQAYVLAEFMTASFNSSRFTRHHVSPTMCMHLDYSSQSVQLQSSNCTILNTQTHDDTIIHEITLVFLPKTSRWKCRKFTIQA